MAAGTGREKLSSGINVVEHSSQYLKAEGSSPVTAPCIRREKASTVVEHSLKHPNVMGSIPGITAGRKREKGQLWLHSDRTLDSVAWGHGFKSSYG